MSSMAERHLAKNNMFMIMQEKNVDEFEKLESFDTDLFSQMGIVGIDEQKALQAAVLKIQKSLN